MTAPVRVFSLQRRPAARSPWIVPWRVHGRSKTRAFRTKAEAEVYRARLVAAASRLEPFDSSTGEPSTWFRSSITYAQAVQVHVGRKWSRWSASSRRSFVDAAAVSVVLMTSTRARGRPDRAVLSRAVRNHLLPPEGFRVDEPSEEEAEALVWLSRASLPLAEILVEQVDAVLDRACMKLDGSPAARNTLNRRRATMNAVFESAVRRKLMSENPLKSSEWAAESASITVDPKMVMSPEQCRDAQTHLSTLGTVGKELSVLVGVMWLSGLRVSEATHLKVCDLELPKEGWGRIMVSGASVQVGARWTNSGLRDDEKGLKWRRNGDTRDVPIPRELVDLLQAHITSNSLTSNDRLFPGPVGEKLSLSTMDQYWRQIRSALFDHSNPLSRMRLSYLRHAHATILLDAGVPVTEVARRLGHSPDVCLRIYAGVMSDGQDQANARIDTVLQAGIEAEKQSREQ